MSPGPVRRRKHGVHSTGDESQGSKTLSPRKRRVGRYPYHWTRTSGAVVFKDRQEVLLVHHTYLGKRWSLPGGHCEPGEDPTTTVVRETFEETGLRVRPVRLTGVYYEPRYDLLHFVFLCRFVDGDLSPRPDGDEVSEVGFFRPGELPRPMLRFTQQRIEDALADRMPALPVSISRKEILR